MRGRACVHFDSAAASARRVRPGCAADRYYGEGWHRRARRWNQAARSLEGERVDARVRRVDEVGSGGWRLDAGSWRFLFELVNSYLKHPSSDLQAPASSV